MTLGTGNATAVLGTALGPATAPLATVPDAPPAEAAEGPALSVRVVRGEPDEIEIAALVAGLAAAAAIPADDTAPIPEWTNRSRTLRGAADITTTRRFDGRAGRHHADAWRWSLRP